MTYEAFSGELLNQGGWRLRIFRRRSRRILDCVMEAWNPSLSKQQAPKKVIAIHEERYGFVPWMWILSIVINLVWQWWLNRGSEELVQRKAQFMKEQRNV